MRPRHRFHHAEAAARCGQCAAVSDRMHGKPATSDTASPRALQKEERHEKKSVTKKSVTKISQNGRSRQGLTPAYYRNQVGD
jgi:hypothetical protein